MELHYVNRIMFINGSILVLTEIHYINIDILHEQNYVTLMELYF